MNAGSVEISSRDRVKTDKRDARKLAQQLESGRLRGIRIPSEAEEYRRLITRTRAQLVKSRSRVMNQVRMRLHQFGLLKPNQPSLSLVSVKKFVSTDIRPELGSSLESLCAVWRTLNGEIAGMNKKLRQQAEADKNERIYRSIPGFGPYSARVCSNEIGDMLQFSNETKLFSFTGMTPQEFTTSEHRRLGHISRQGSARLRHVLLEAAWRAVRIDPGLKKDFDRIAQRAGKKRAIVAIARKLIGRARALFRKQELYQLKLAA